MSKYESKKRDNALEKSFVFFLFVFFFFFYIKCKEKYKKIKTNSGFVAYEVKHLRKFPGVSGLGDKRDR